MPSTANFTVTGSSGPAQTLMAKTFTGVKSYFVDLARMVLCLHFSSSDQTAPNLLELDLTGITTFTTSISGSTWTVTVS